MNGLSYLLQVNMYLIAFYTFYSIFLKKETFFHLNRFYLIGSTLVSFFIPILQSEWVKNLGISEQVQEATLNFNVQTYALLFQPQAEIPVLLLGDVLLWIYFAVAGALFVRFIFQIYTALRAIKENESLKACSFFGYIAVDETLEGKEAIMVHELVHAQQLHSADVLFFELVAIINWFNPIVYLYKQAIKNIHEYIADAAACETLPEKADYARLLFHENFGVKPQKLTNSFFNQSILKQRIMMLQKNKSKRIALWKYGFIAPLFLGMLILSSGFVSEKTEKTQQVLETNVWRDTIPPVSELKKGEQPLYVVDGKEIKAENLSQVDQSKIATVNVIKGEKAIQTYGKKGEHGVVEITLKQGEKVAIFQKTDKSPLLYVVDGKEVKGVYLSQIDQNKIATIDVINGEKAVKMYGKKGENGVVEITLKKTNGESLPLVPPVPPVPPARGVPVNPLYVVNGKTMDGAFLVQSLNPSDIESINVLKDQTAIEKYGDAGKNGVVEIMLKKTGIKETVASVSQLDKNPEFPGGQAAWAKYLQSEMKYPKEARIKQSSGRVILSFIVEKSGELSDIKVVKSISKELDEEAIRVLQKSPKWTPGNKGGELVRVAYTMPITFALQATNK